MLIYSFIYFSLEATKSQTQFLSSGNRNALPLFNLMRLFNNNNNNNNKHIMVHFIFYNCKRARSVSKTCTRYKMKVSAEKTKQRQGKKVKTEAGNLNKLQIPCSNCLK